MYEEKAVRLCSGVEDVAAECCWAKLFGPSTTFTNPSSCC